MLSQSDAWHKQADSMAAIATLNTARTIITVTRHWSVPEYLRAAAIAKLELAALPCDLDFIGASDSSILRKYAVRPKFSLLSLRKREDAVDQTFGVAVPLILIAGSSGTGKTMLAHYLKATRENVMVVNLDDFSLEENDERLVKKRGKPDWECVENVDMRAAASAIDCLVRGGDARIPIYNMSQSLITGHCHVSGAGASAIVVEGIFALQLFVPAPATITRVLLSGSGPGLLSRRVARDCAEQRRSRLHAILHSMRLWWTDRRCEAANREVADLTYPYRLSHQKLAERIWAEVSVAERENMVFQRDAFTND